MSRQLAAAIPPENASRADTGSRKLLAVIA
jgi:hypothetical protein